MDEIYDATVDTADLVVGGLFPTVERYSAFDLTWPYFTDAISSYVIARLPVPHWHYPIAVLTPRMWAALFGLMALLGGCSTVHVSSAKFSKYELVSSGKLFSLHPKVGVLRATNGGSLQYYALILWGVLSDGEPKPRLPRGPGRSVCFVFLWTVFCLHFNSGYRASLATASINPLTRPGPCGLDDVQRIAFVGNLGTFLLRDNDSRIEIFDSAAKCSEQILNDPENMAYVTTDLTIWSLTPKYFLDENLHPLMRKTETLATFFVSFLVNKDSVLQILVNRSLKRAVECGMQVKAMKELFLMVKLEIERQARIKLREHKGTDLSGAIILLQLGLLLALAVFLAELMYHRIKVPWVQKRPAA
ncbi:tRNA modification GTPase MnmE [Frankliniella fusca]|uniref:tRNA modification GTPase MnmE n=1 Tax=Frankliniella fusca TaxID=407009 RepID=A0AAE1HWI2_9NEOP|nr:tRNA modification GTPase MnmE [Frankliniella fusca]